MTTLTPDEAYIAFIKTNIELQQALQRVERLACDTHLDDASVALGLAMAANRELGHIVPDSAVWNISFGNNSDRLYKVSWAMQNTVIHRQISTISIIQNWAKESSYELK